MNNACLKNAFRQAFVLVMCCESAIIRFFKWGDKYDTVHLAGRPFSD